MDIKIIPIPILLILSSAPLLVVGLGILQE
jgi:hypothetical protein